MNIGMNIKNRREKLGITQKQMAENLSLTQSMIAQVERGTKIPNMILGLAIVVTLMIRNWSPVIIGIAANMILGLAIARMLGCTMEDLMEDAKDE